MFKINQNEKEFRFEDSGPKYLMKGPRMNFGVLRLNPGQIFAPHYHNVMEENFFITDGCVEFTINDEKVQAQNGDFIHCEPGEIHAMRNSGQTAAIINFMMSPFTENDKVEVSSLPAE